MSQENVEIVQRHIEAWNRRDLRKWLPTFRYDAEIDWSRARGPQKGVYRGRGGHEAFWEVWLTFDWHETETYDLTEAGSEVVVPNTTTFHGRQGIEVAAKSAFVFTVEKGQITRLRMFQERAEALEAVGLSE
jgi:ketosteroid isomerase-like protein